ncbi:hypothetical protein VNO77_27892 [Canavalia gladiata]|uniref:Uncharacterized protein n=1 Tax=Canavalia gladiata TaxID=3824 RepID=A0AAN9KVI3_CANGL
MFSVFLFVVLSVNCCIGYLFVSASMYFWFIGFCIDVGPNYFYEFCLLSNYQMGIMCCRRCFDLEVQGMKWKFISLLIRLLPYIFYELAVIVARENELKYIIIFWSDTTSKVVSLLAGVLNREQGIFAFYGNSFNDKGPMGDKNIRRVRFEISYVVLRANAIQRGEQIIPTARRVFYAAMLTAKPRLVEPGYLVQIQAPKQALGVAYLPVVSLKPNELLRAQTGGQAFPQLVFDHRDIWCLSDPLEPDFGVSSPKLDEKHDVKSGLNSQLHQKSLILKL